MQHVTARRRWVAVLALLVAACAIVGAGAPASAAPRPLAAPGESGDDGEGGSKSLLDKLDEASKGYVTAKTKLQTSKTQQTKLAATLKELDAAIGPQQKSLNMYAVQAYTMGRLGPLSALLSADTTEGFLDRAQLLTTVAERQNQAVSDLRTTRDNQVKAKTAIDATIVDQQRQVNVMAARKTQAEQALKEANQGSDSGDDSGSSGGSTDASKPSGSLSGGCTVDDPTTTGCITPRLNFALKQAQAAGFNHYVACFRHQNSGEHPKGRACDFAADKGGFGGVATGSSKTYGTNLANYFIHNADTLGVLYVIWFKRIWLPSSGWKSYSGAGGTPSTDHTNHVHLSVT
ncbi:coiled-coil domain-containing protein [Actinoplanes sp. HUAS TT8]|uniref:coiled-coil domain-containing protein n=1 Tax=Actinoplanes sp. HUAS TT8 TaxID=3447453 RepID=UPI003F527B2F